MSLSRFACRCGLLIAALLSVVDPLCAQVAATRPVYRSMPAVECQVRDGLGNVMAKIEAGQPVRIAYLGGSITEMDGWRRLSREWLQAQYPACAFSETHAAIGGTGSSLGVYRVGEHVLKYDPDLVFVEFAVNDAAEAEWTIWKNFEGVVRQIWKHDPCIDIVFVYTVRDTMVPCYQSGMCPHSASAMEMLAEHYGIPSVCFGPRVAADVSAGLLVMNGGYAATAVPAEDFDNEERLADIYEQRGKRLFSKDGVHPILRAHRFYYLAAIENSWPALAAPAAVDHASRLGVPFYDTVMERAKQVFPDPGLLTGAWEKLPSGWERQFGSSPWFTQTPGDSFHFRFRGSACKLYCIFGNDCGQVFVTVDGVRRPEPVPLFDRDCTYYRAAVLPVFAGEEGIHEVTVELDTEQPDRNAVGSEATANPTKYDGTRWYCGGILLLGDLDLTPLTDPFDGSVRHVDGPRVVIERAPREICKSNGKTLRFNAAVRFTPDRETVGSYGSWTVGIAVAFDQTMPSDGVSFRTCDCHLDGETIPIGVSGDWIAGEFRRIRMDSPLSLSEMVAASGIVLGVSCSLDASPSLGMTVELRLQELADGLETGRYMTLGRATRKIIRSSAASWFDARVCDYADWPSDAALAEFGSWSAGSESLSDVADVVTAGVLDIDAQTPLAFTADVAKEPDDNTASLSVSSELVLPEYGLDELPSVDPDWKGSVIVVLDGDVRAYYGLSNGAWVRLDGVVPPTDDRAVELKMTFSKIESSRVVTYEIDGTLCSSQGMTSLPVIATGAVSVVEFAGRGRLRLLTGGTERRRTGLVSVIR